MGLLELFVSFYLFGDIYVLFLVFPLLIVADSRGRLVAGSFQGYAGHVDGKPSDARFNHPKGVTMDEKGNVYIADTMNFAIRKIGDAGICRL